MYEPNNNLSLVEHVDIDLDKDMSAPRRLPGHTDIELVNNVVAQQGSQLRRRHTILSRQASVGQVINHHFGNIIHTQNNIYNQHFEIVNNSNNTTTNIYNFKCKVVNSFNGLVAVGNPVEIVLLLGAIYLQDFMMQTHDIQPCWWMMVNSMILLSNVSRIWDWSRKRGNDNNNNDNNNNDNNDNNNGNDSNNNGRMEQPLFLQTPFFHTVQEIFRLTLILEWIFVRIVDKDWHPPEQRFYTFIDGVSYRYYFRPFTNFFYDVKQWAINHNWYFGVTGTVAFYAGVERGCYKRMMIVFFAIIFGAYMEKWAARLY